MYVENNCGNCTFRSNTNECNKFSEVPVIKTIGPLRTRETWNSNDVAANNKAVLSFIPTYAEQLQKGLCFQPKAHPTAEQCLGEEPITLSPKIAKELASILEDCLR